MVIDLPSLRRGSMSSATIERERGDDRDPVVSIERLDEMFNQPDAEEPSYARQDDLRPSIG
jgi:hypothetical protein